MNINNNSNKLLNTIKITDNYIIDSSNKNWCSYLYSIFGKEYKNWYISQLKDEFEMIFS